MDSLDMFDKLQDVVLDTGRDKTEKPEYHFDKLKMYFGQDYNYKGIIISIPTIGDILEAGENRFYSSLSPFLYNSTSIRLFLWENGIDWNGVKDIEVFAYLMPIVKDREILRLIFKNITLDDFRLAGLREAGGREEQRLALYSQSQDILLYEEDYMVIAEYIRAMLNMHPKVEKAKGKTAKSWMIQEDKMDAQQRKNDNASTLLPLISACVNHPGFKYKLQELKEVNIYQFMDSVKRIQKYENATAALKGCYSGFVSGKDIPEDTLNYMGDI